MEKACFKCTQVKPLTEFYKHAQMGDGHLNKCKECTRKDTENRYNALRTDPAFLEKERERGRDKFRRLYREGKKPYSPRVRLDGEYIDRFPEIKLAHQSSGGIPRIPGFQNHHWSYDLKHAKDIIRLPKQTHYEAHRYLIYVQAEKCFATAQGVLLDTKEKHLAYLDRILIFAPAFIGSA